MGATLGYNGVVSGGQFTLRDRTYELVDPLAVPDPSCEADFEITQLSLNASDGNGDGVADLIGGNGVGTGSIVEGDTIPRFTFSFDLSGTPDVTRPTLISPGVIHPIDGVRLAASEALAPTSQLSLQGTSSVTLENAYVGSVPLGTLSSHLVLPFAGNWAVVGHAEDLIGLPLETGLALTSLPDPGIFVEDGFEGAALAAVLTGGAQVVSSVGSLPALRGSKSLQVVAGESATLHLARPPGATTVRFVARTLRGSGGFPICPEHDSGTDPPAVTLGVIGGVIRSRPVAQQIGDSVVITGATFDYAGPLQDVSIPIEEVGSDIVLRIAPPTNPNFTFCFPHGVLVDDLRVQ